MITENQQINQHITNTCPVCNEGWKGYGGNYDELCNKHYLEIEPTGEKNDN